MRKAPSISTATVILAVFLCLEIPSSRVMACQECLCFPGDKTCTDVGCTKDLKATCVKTLFSPACSGEYSIYTETRCTGGGSCQSCQACANIYQVSGGTETFLANGHTNGCSAGLCINTVTPTVRLSSGITYAIYVCKVTCPGPGDLPCEACPSTCTAYACISYGVINCSAP